jgi:hypothetical protein
MLAAVESTMADILTRCPKTGEPIRTGVTSEMVELDTLPKVLVPVQCSACGGQHSWTPSTAWVGDDTPTPTDSE